MYNSAITEMLADKRKQVVAELALRKRSKVNFATTVLCVGLQAAIIVTERL